jgi:hypothetical protein
MNLIDCCLSVVPAFRAAFGVQPEASFSIEESCRPGKLFSPRRFHEFSFRSLDDLSIPYLVVGG